jgi:hypothetical protein
LKLLILKKCSAELTGKPTFFCQDSLPNQDTEDLEQDLKDAVKKVHLRVILKEHARLKTLKLPEPAADAARACAPSTCKPKKCVDSSVAKLIPCAKDVMSFQPLGPNRTSSKQFSRFFFAFVS